MSDVRARALEITIDRQALRHNLEVVRRLAPNARVFAVIKADAYGHGAREVARTLSSAEGLAVVAVSEAQDLRDDGETRPILVMQGPRDRADAALCQQLELWPAVQHPAQADWLADKTSSVPAWLKVDTGMGRLGVMLEQVDALLARRDLHWKGVMTHLACADAPGNAHTQAQIDAFDAIDRASLSGSIANSAALVSGVGTSLDWVRPGLMLYGCNPLDGLELPSGVSLAPAMTVRAPLVSIKQYPANAGIGYSQTWTTPEPMPIGYAAVGYADGLPRVLDAAADVLVNGKRCPIVGRVSMDSIAVDLRNAPRSELGDRVTLWGDGQPAERLAASAGTISYELLTSVRGRRRYV